MGKWLGAPRLLDVVTSIVQEELLKFTEARETIDNAFPLLLRATQTHLNSLLSLGSHLLGYEAMLVLSELACVCFSSLVFSVLFVTKLGS